MLLQQVDNAGEVSKVLRLIIAQGKSAEDTGDFAVALYAKHPVQGIEVFRILERNNLQITS